MKFLAKGEKTYLSFRTSRKYPPLLKFFLAGIVFFAISAVFFFNILEFLKNIPLLPNNEFLAFLAVFPGIFLIIIGEMRRRKIGTYYITNFRIVVTRGVVGTKMESLSYSMIVNVKISQSFSEKIFGLGNLEISTARGTQELNMIGIPNPRKVENLIYRFLESHTGGEYQRRPEQPAQQPRRAYRPSRYYKPSQSKRYKRR